MEAVERPEVWDRYLLRPRRMPVIHSDDSDGNSDQILEASSSGNWVTTESMQVWVENHQGWEFGSSLAQQLIGRKDRS